MNIDELLNYTAHRPWQMPVDKWVLYQEWNRAIFLHWKVEKECLVKLIPSPLEIDLYEGSAWVSIVVFFMENIRPRFLPSFKYLSNFAEVNIRTYVSYGGKPGVYFLSIEGANKCSNLIARSIAKLPYRYSKIVIDSRSVSVENFKKKDHLSFNFLPKESIDNKIPLDKWLVERYSLHQDYKKSIISYEVHHMPWLIKEVSIDNLNLKYQQLENVLSGHPDLSHYSPGVQVLSWKMAES